MGRKEPNAWGLNDMHGNVSEWTETAAVNGMYRVISGGGSWDRSFSDCESEEVLWCGPSGHENNIGFRLCATPSPAASEPHAESAENAEPNPHAESAEGAESGTPAGGASERSEPEGGLA